MKSAKGTWTPATSFIYYVTIGQGPPLVILHGGPGSNHEYFLPYLLPLAKHRRLVLIDERGCGRSQRLSDSTQYTLDGMAYDVEAVRVALNLGEIDILGAFLRRHSGPSGSCQPSSQRASIDTGGHRLVGSALECRFQKNQKRFAEKAARAHRDAGETRGYRGGWRTTTGISTVGRRSRGSLQLLCSSTRLGQRGISHGLGCADRDVGPEKRFSHRRKSCGIRFYRGSEPAHSPRFCRLRRARLGFGRNRPKKLIRHWPTPYCSR